MKVEQIFEEQVDWQEGKISDRRASPRSPVPGAMEVIANHMFKIKRALDAGDVDVARSLVDGALKTFRSNASRDENG